jgi:hypothetical protein
MQHQMTLFGELSQRTNQYGTPLESPPIARASDPEPSHLAAEQIKSGLSSLQALFVSVLRQTRRSMTAHEVAAQAIVIGPSDRIESIMQRRETLRKRAGELVAIKWIRIAGQRRCEVTGNMASVYEVMV